MNKSQYQRIDAVYNKKQFIPIKHTYTAIGQDDCFSYKESPEYISELINRRTEKGDEGIGINYHLREFGFDISPIHYCIEVTAKEEDGTVSLISAIPVLTNNQEEATEVYNKVVELIGEGVEILMAGGVKLKSMKETRLNETEGIKH